MDQMLAWLNDQLQDRHLPDAHVHSRLVRQDGDWYYVPVYVNMRDAYDKATLLQEIEDAWEKQGVQPDRNLLLIPSAN